MKKQLSFFDIIRFIIALAVFFYVLDSLESWGASLINDDMHITVKLLFNFFFVDFIPTLLGIFTAVLFISWRYKLIAGILLLFTTIATYFIILPGYTKNWILFLSYIVKFSLGLIGALAAILIWNILGDKFKYSMIQTKDLKLAKTKPKTSFLLLMLSLFSIPLTYITMFCSAFITLGLSLLILYLICHLPRIPVVVIVAGVLAPLVGFWAGIRALWVMFFPPLDFQPATILDLNKYPTLKSVINNVCAKIKTRKPSVVLLHSEPTFFVMQGKVNSFDGIVKGRILAIGMPLLKEMTSLELSSVLAHEFAHFSGGDTLYSTIVSSVYRGITASMNELSGATEGSSSDNNAANLMGILLLPSRIFLGLFLNYFATIDMILSRGRELRADWVAANLFGANSFSSALTKVTAISQHFNDNYENLALNSQSDFFDKHSDFIKTNLAKIEEYKTKALSLKENDFDSHPSLSTRLANLPDNTIDGSELTNEMQNLRIELLEKEKDLAQKYTSRIKKIKEFWEQYSKLLAEQQAQQQALPQDEKK